MTVKIVHKAVTVIVPVWNNPAQLELCIDALQQQDYPSDQFEIVIVDNGSTDDTVIRGTRKGVKVLHQSKPGSYAARNLGIANTSSDYIAFTDSDCIPDRKWLSSAMGRAKQEPNLGVLAGRIVLFSEVERKSQLWAEHYETLVAFPQHQAALGVCATANWLSPRSAIIEGGCFDETVKSGGDHHMALKIRANGRAMLYEADMVVLHPTRASLKSLLAKRRRLTGGHWDRAHGSGKFIRTTGTALKEAGRRGKRIILSSDVPITSRLKAAAVLTALAVAEVGEYSRLALGGQTVR